MATINGTTGNDTVTSTANADILNGLAGNDTLNGNAGADTLYGGDGNDALFGGTEDDLMNGGAGNDLFDGGDGIDTLDYTGSNAAVYVSLANGTAEGGHAVGDTFTLMENLTGSFYNDTLVGDIGDNVLTGNNGDDTLEGGIGADTMYGGAGNDVYYIGNTGDVVSEAGGSGTDTVYSSVTYTMAEGVEVLHLTGTSVIHGTGNEAANKIYGNDGTGTLPAGNLLQGLGGNDTIYGGDGADTIDGGTGANHLYGGAGSDVFLVNNVNDQVYEYSGQGEDTIVASIDITLYDPITSNFVEHVTLTGTADLWAIGNLANNQLTGNEGNNLLTGHEGADTLRGNAGNDYLDGGVGNDGMIGGTGDDMYIVDSLNDDVVENSGGGIDSVNSEVSNYGLENYVENLTLSSATAYNVLNGNGNGLDNILTGNLFANNLAGEAGADTLYGGDGNDSLYGGTDGDLMEGGAGDDVYYVDHAGDVTSEAAVGSSGYDRVFTTAHHTLGEGIEELTVVGSGDDNGTGNALNNILTGGAGDSVLNGMDGNDTLNAGDGEDTLIGGAGVDVFVGGEGNDVYVIENATESITEVLNDGIDTVQIDASYTLSEHLESLELLGSANHTGIGNASANRMTGNTGNNQLTTGDANDSLYGGAGDDTLDGGTGDDSMVGGLGNDLYVVDATTDKLVETSTGGTDTVHASVSYALGNYLERLTLTGTANINGTGNSLANVLLGNGGNNNLFGDGGNDTITGGDGDDTLNGGSGVDSMTGGNGNDTYYVDNALDVISEAAAAGSDRVVSTLSHILSANFEHVTLVGTAGNSATGNAGGNSLIGNGGSNKLYGLAGDDSLLGGAGADTLDGGTGLDVMTGGIGNDTFIIDSTGDVVLEDVAGGTDTIVTLFTSTLTANLENLTFAGTSSVNGTGNASANRIIGNAGNNWLQGLDGNDSLYGGDGADILDGDAGNDYMAGGLGNDTYYVTSATDIISEASIGGTDLVYTSASYTMAAGLEQLVMQGTASYAATGNTSANTMTGNIGNNSMNGGSGADTLYGGLGDDTLNGSIGNDLMYGGAGDDVYYVNAKNDVLGESADAGTDTVMAATTWVLGNNVEHLTMVSTGAYRGTGNALDNVMTGNNGKNILSGMGGADTLNGGLGNDTLTGGEGADHFVFSTATAGSDTITDFNAVNSGAAEGDRLVFDGLLVGTFSYLGDAAFSGGGNNSEARYDAATKKLLIDTDGNGVANFALTLTGMDADTEITAGMFIWS